MDPSAGLATPTSDRSRSPRPGRAEQRWSCRVTPLGGARYTLHFSGSLHASWTGQLAAGLAARHVSVVRARARRGHDHWTADIELLALDPAVTLSAADFIALMREQPDASDPGTLRLSGWRVTPGKKDVEVEIRGEDAVGFLGRVLLLFAGVGLYPHEMQVETVARRVRDVFRLQGESGQTPPVGIVAALEQRLAKLTDG
jgi:hypothetical protein